MIFAPRIRPCLRDEIARLAELRAPIAEINRRVGGKAARMRLPKPSYEQVRVLVHAARRVSGATRARTRVFAVHVRVAFGVTVSLELPERRRDAVRERRRDRAPPM